MIAITTAVVIAGGLLGISTTTAAYAATTGPADDRVTTTPTDWSRFANWPPSYLGSQLSARNARLTDLRVNTISGGLTFSGTMVANTTPAYAAGWWWYYNQTKDSVVTLLSQNHARLLTAQRYNANVATGTPDWRYAVVMVANTGADYRAWDWTEGSYQEIGNFVTAHPGYRMTALSTDVNRLVSTGTDHYLTIMVDNTGGYGWYWYIGISADALGSALQTTQARLVDLDPNENGTFSAVLYNAPTAWGWWYGVSADVLEQRARQSGGRLIDITPYRANGSWYYAGVVIENSAGLTAQLRGMFAPQVYGDGAMFGFRLAQVDGPVLAALNENQPFEPASALKALHHLQVVRAEQAGPDVDATPITYHYATDPTFPSGGEAGFCPSDANVPNVGTTTLANADLMMGLHSDNRTTRAIEDHYGRTALMSTANLAGLTSTQLNSLIGCGHPPNATTLVDLARIYDAGYVRTDILDATHRELFRSRGIDEGVNAMCDLAHQEVTTLHLSPSVETAFCASIIQFGKPGRYTTGGKVWRAWSGMIGIPFKNGSSTQLRLYSWGAFVHNATEAPGSDEYVFDNLLLKARQEAMRPQIDAALATF